MTRHDESLLWEYAARELEPEEARLVQHHLSECPECEEKLSDVRLAQGALNAARSAPLSLSYGRVDATLSKVIDRKLRSQAFGRRWVFGLSGGLVAVGAALVAFGLWPRLTSPAPAPVAPVVAAVEAPRVVPVIENAEALTRVGVTSEVMQKGGVLESGDVLKTALHGKATLKLPEGTRVAMTGSTQLALTRAQKDEIALSLERGHVAVAASHARERKGFVLHTNGLMVTVVGTVFSVTSSRDTVEVAVSEGRVSVEAPEGLPQFVNAGQRVQFETNHWRSSRGPLPASEKKELNALAQGPAPELVPPAPPPVPVRQAVVPSNGGMTQTPAAIAIEELVPLPALEKTEKKIEPVAVAAAPVAPEPAHVAAAAPAPEPEPEQIVGFEPAPMPAPAPAAAPHPSKAPDMSGLSIPLIASPVESVGPPPEQREWNRWGDGQRQPVLLAAAEPKRRTPTYAPSFEAAPARPSAAKLSEIPADQAGIYMKRVADSLGNGTCAGYLNGLSEVADDPNSPNAEEARVFRARCFDATRQPQKAYNEYARYLRQYPRGRFVEEAQQVLGER
jgi:hypothetical protein